MRLSALKWAPAAGLAGALALWMGGYIVAERSDGFAFARAAIQGSPVIRGSVGAVESVRLSPWGFALQYVGDEAEATFECEVQGRLRDARVVMRLHGDGDRWRVTTARLDGQLIELDTARVAVPDTVESQTAAPPDSTS